ncbi:MAG: type II toxin-antitoxin system RelE/ParE family toxin [Methylocystis sp.]|nr:type II toxin-antitoxin system RelE/ParE family toxin [Methylocystis sp.]
MDADSAAIYAELDAKAGKPTVLKYRALFRRLYEHLADFPDSGPPRYNLGPKIRIGVVSPYIVIYRHVEADNTLIVLRIVHGKRKITGKMLQRQ